MEKVLVTGGAGYVGCVLVPKLLDSGYDVVVYDTLYYGKEGLPNHPRLQIVEGDIRDTELYRKTATGCDAVIHLACLSNDPSCELNPEVTKSINYDCFEPLVKASKEAGIKRFINVSTSSVYGISDAPEVTEEHPLVPLTDYNRYKGMCEPILKKYESPDFTAVTARPATVSGYSTRTRLDLSVNILTNLAVNKGKITVFGGAQKRPNVHIEDVTDFYVKLLQYPHEKIHGQVFNVSEKNYTISEMANIVKAIVEEEFPESGNIDIETTTSNDQRSYHVTSRKALEQLGFEAKRTVGDAVLDLCAAFKANKLPNSLEDSRYFNIKRMKELGVQ